jgi:hypothetical protein
MMVDSGATSCSLTPEAARLAGLHPDHRVILTTMAGDLLVPAASDAQVRVGAAEADAVEVLTLDPEGVRAGVGRVDGVLGQSFLSRFPYLLDYEKRLLWLGDEADRQSRGLSREIQTERADGRLMLRVAIDQGAKSWWLTLDTGANAMVVWCGRRCPQLHGVKDDHLLVTNSGTSRVRQGKVRRVEVGARGFVEAQVALVDGETSESREEGVLPANWFAAVYVDNARKVVRLR